MLLLGGGGAVVVSIVRDSTGLGAAVGRWEQPGRQPIPGFELSPTVLTISSEGRFTFSLGMRMTLPELGPSGDFADLGDISVDCSGTVAPTGDRFTLHSTAGPCGTFEARLSSDGRVIDLFLDGPAEGSMALVRVSS